MEATRISPIIPTARKHGMLGFMSRRKAGTFDAPAAPAPVIEVTIRQETYVPPTPITMSPPRPSPVRAPPIRLPVAGENAHQRPQNVAFDIPSPVSPDEPPPPPPPRAKSAFGIRLMKKRSESSLTPASSTPTSKYHRIRFVPFISPTSRSPSLHFDPTVRVLKPNKYKLTLGRYIDPENGRGLDALFAMEGQATMVAEEKDKKSDRVLFKSKVVSRTHALIWVDDSGQFWVKDTMSSSGTFLNHHRLSSANQESKPHPIKDGDVLQLGMDFQGGREEVYRCIRIKLEIGPGKDWQASANAFNTSALQVLRSPESGRSTGRGECCICLSGVTVCQALFVAPCSHVFHYRCIRPMLDRHYPGFSCPMCRTFADLEADPDPDEVYPTLDEVLDGYVSSEDDDDVRAHHSEPETAKERKGIHRKRLEIDTNVHRGVNVRDDLRTVVATRSSEGIHASPNGLETLVTTPNLSPRLSPLPPPLSSTTPSRLTPIESARHPRFGPASSSSWLPDD